MSIILSLTSTLVLFLSTALTVGAENFSNADNSTGVELFMSAPACDFFRCTNEWPYGSTQLINWFLPPAGNVSVQLAGIGKNNSDVTYDIVKSMPANTSPDCDSGRGVGKAVKGQTCGGLYIVVPSEFAPGNYTVAVTSLSNRTLQGFTDTVIVTFVNQTLPVPSKVIVDIGPAGSVSSLPVTSSKASGITTSTKAKTTSQAAKNVATTTVTTTSTSASSPTSSGKTSAVDFDSASGANQMVAKLGSGGLIMSLLILLL